MRRPPSAVLSALLLTVGLLAAPVAAGADPIPPKADTKIVGGSQAPEGAFPWTAALTRRGATRPTGFGCGGTVLSRSWVLTAAHCVLDYDDDYPDGTYGDYVAPAYWDVITGTNSIAEGGGGQRLPVVAIYPHPSYDYVSNDNDVALLRIGRPTTAPEIKVIGSSSAELALDDAGKVGTTIGWGTTYQGGGAQTFQRFVNVPIQTNATCQSAYPKGRVDELGFPLEYHAATMLCAGPMSGGKDSCQGDSGGPIAVQAPDTTWRQVGVVSFGDGCARAGNPGVYSRLTATANWISNTRRFGPFNPDGAAFVKRQYVDFTGKQPTSAQLADWTAKLRSQPASNLITALQGGAAWQGNAAALTRLYSASFERLPDTGGLTHWVGRRWAGVGPVAIANNYASSSEFVGKYGSLDDDGFITQIYANVFHRAADAGGRTYWRNKLGSGVGRGQMVYELSNSNEYRTATASTVRVVTTWFGLLRRVPTSGELAADSAKTVRTMADALRTSVSYANRFTS